MCDKHLKFVSHLSDCYLESTERLLQAHGDWLILCKFVRLVLSIAGHVHLELEVGDDFDQTVLLLMKAEETLVEVQSQMKFVAALLDGKNALLHLGGIIEID